MVRLGKFPDEAKKLELIYRPCVGGEPGLDRRQKRRRRRCRRDVKPKLLPELTVDDVRNLVDEPVVDSRLPVDRDVHLVDVGLLDDDDFARHRP